MKKLKLSIKIGLALTIFLTLFFFLCGLGASYYPATGCN